MFCPCFVEFNSISLGLSWQMRKFLVWTIDVVFGYITCLGVCVVFIPPSLSVLTREVYVTVSECTVCERWRQTAVPVPLLSLEEASTAKHLVPFLNLQISR